METGVEAAGMVVNTSKNIDLWPDTVSIGTVSVCISALTTIIHAGKTQAIIGLPINRYPSG